MAADICIVPRGSRVEVIATTEVVDITFMIWLIDALADVLGNASHRRILLEVNAPKCLVNILDRVEFWNHAVRRQFFGRKIAHVITGRPVTQDEVFKENHAGNRGIIVRTFAARVPAQTWLEKEPGG